MRRTELPGWTIWLTTSVLVLGCGGDDESVIDAAVDGPTIDALAVDASVETDAPVDASSDAPPGTDAPAACSGNPVVTAAYLLAFHSCDAAGVGTCSNPMNHTVRLAGSDDGTTWSLLSSFESFSGSVPELFEYGDELYVFHAGATSGWKRLDSRLCVLETSPVNLVSLDPAGYVDPSLILEGSTPYLFYLPGVLGGDPAGCTSYPCTKAIHGATGNSTLKSFTQVTLTGTSKMLSAGTFSDPEILRFGGTYYLYVSAGSSTLVFTSSAITGTYSEQGNPISNGQGGVPSAIEGDDGMVWLYVTSNVAGVEVIKMAKSANGTTVTGSFTTVLDHSISGSFPNTTSVSSPSIAAKPTAW